MGIVKFVRIIFCMHGNIVIKNNYSTHRKVLMPCKKKVSPNWRFRSNSVHNSRRQKHKKNPNNKLKKIPTLQLTSSPQAPCPLPLPRTYSTTQRNSITNTPHDTSPPRDHADSPRFKSARTACLPPVNTNLAKYWR